MTVGCAVARQFDVEVVDVEGSKQMLLRRVSRVKEVSDDRNDDGIE